MNSHTHTHTSPPPPAATIVANAEGRKSYSVPPLVKDLQITNNQRKENFPVLE